MAIIVSLIVPLILSFTTLPTPSPFSSASRIPIIANDPGERVCDPETSAIKFVSEEIKAVFPSSSSSAAAKIEVPKVPSSVLSVAIPDTTES